MGAYHDPYGGVWRTDGIVASTSDIIAASRVQDALRALPNEVLEGVSVKARTSSTVSLCTRFYAGVQHLGGYSETTDGAFKNSKMTTNFCETTYQLGLGTRWTSPSSSPTSPARPACSTSWRLTSTSVVPALSPSPVASLAPAPTPWLR